MSKKSRMSTWTFLEAMMLYPEVQLRAQKEIGTVLLCRLLPERICTDGSFIRFRCREPHPYLGRPERYPHRPLPHERGLALAASRGTGSSPYNDKRSRVSGSPNPERSPLAPQCLVRLSQMTSLGNKKLGSSFQGHPS